MTTEKKSAKQQAKDKLNVLKGKIRADKDRMKKSLNKPVKN